MENQKENLVRLIKSRIKLFGPDCKDFLEGIAAEWDIPITSVNFYYRTAYFEFIEERAAQGDKEAIMLNYMINSY